MAEKKEKKSSTPFKYIALGVVFIAFLIYGVYAIASINSQIAEKEEQLNAINNEIVIQEAKNADIEQVKNYSDEEYLEYVISKARKDLDLVEQGERVFINSAGD
ncbi:MAG: septum formation initiator family protein [Ruminococcus sp.]|nr:septum formation initiator family protein [Ruminococcus sp.]